MTSNGKKDTTLTSKPYEIDLTTEIGFMDAEAVISQSIGSLYAPRISDFDHITLVGVQRIIVKTEDMAPLLQRDINDIMTKPMAKPTYVHILDWKIEDKVNAQKVLKVACAAYLISLSASANRGINERCHIPFQDIIDDAIEHLLDANMTITPHDCVYGSSEMFWDGVIIDFDQETGTLTIDPELGS